MTSLLAAAALAAAQAAPAAPVDHNQHSAAQHAQHQQQGHGQHHGQHDCCKNVDGKMVCAMMKGDGAQHQGPDGKGDHQSHAH